jgi:predicted helicase
MRGRYRQRRRQTAHRRLALREVLPCRFPRTAKALGIVYTPTQIVDFVLRAANDALHAEFGTTLSQPDVHILGTGTGTFIVRLIQTGSIDPKDLARRYSSELHADEIVLLAYYIAAINVEAAYHGVAGGDYQPFDGMVLTDTFQITEAGDTMDAELFPQNNDRIIAQQASPIRVIVGNRPTSRASPAPTTTTPTAKDPDLTVEDAVDYDEAKISWLSGLLPKVQRGQHLTYQPNHRRMAMYRPFCKMHVYFALDLPADRPQRRAIEPRRRRRHPHRVPPHRHNQHRRPGRLPRRARRRHHRRRDLLSGIPDDAHRYQLGARSALEWIIERYQTKADSKGSGIVNDPNAWCDEHNDPRYIIDLIKRIVTVSITTMSIVDGLPELHAPAALSTSH